MTRVQKFWLAKNYFWDNNLRQGMMGFLYRVYSEDNMKFSYDTVWQQKEYFDNLPNPCGILSMMKKEQIISGRLLYHWKLD